MLEPGDQAQIDRLERRVYQLERANWKRADFAFRVTMYGFSVAIVIPGCRLDRPERLASRTLSVRARPVL